MLHFAFAEIVQVRVPARERREILCHAFRKQDVSYISAIHDPLRHIDARSRHVRSIVHIGDLIYRPTVNTHAQQNLRIVF